jgi:hypothetical protein
MLLALVAILSLGQTAGAASLCGTASAAGPTAAAGEICAGDEAAKRAARLEKQTAAWTRELDAAVDHYDRAVRLASTETLAAQALNAISVLLDADHLNDLTRLERTLQQLMQLAPTDYHALARLVAAQEKQGPFESAERTLLDAHHSVPEALEPLRLLAQFFARRATAQHGAAIPPREPSPPGVPDANGIIPPAAASSRIASRRHSLRRRPKPPAFRA